MINLFPTGLVGPIQPTNSKWTTVLLIMSATVFSVTTGYDSGLMTGLNIMPAYTEFLKLTTATRSLNVSANFIGWGIASLTMGPVVNLVGRKNAIFMSLILKSLSVGLIAGAQSFPMFITGRIMLGLAKGTSTMSGSAWLAETLPPKIRGAGLAITYSVYYVGALIAAGVTYRTAQIPGNWSWRLPCLLQIVPSIVSGICLFCTPESPRWLIYQDRDAQALTVASTLLSDGCESDTRAVTHLQEITASRDWERGEGRSVAVSDLFKAPSSRRRMILAMSVAVLAMGSGNNIASYYLGDMLSNAGITDRNTQLEVNVVLNSWCLVCAGIGTVLMDRVGRKSLARFGCAGMTILMFVVGALTKEFSQSTNMPGIYGTVAGIFLFMGFYGIGVTPVTSLYPAEVLSFPLRANGMAVWAGTISVFAIGTTLVFPIALEAIAWRLYFIIGAWDFLEFLFVQFFWIETKGLTLEEIDRIFDDVRYDGQDPAQWVEETAQEEKDLEKAKVETQVKRDL